MDHPNITIKGVLEFAIAIEEESAAYYRAAIEKNLYDPKDPEHLEIVRTLELLVLEEIRHKTRLKEKLEAAGAHHNRALLVELRPLMDDLVPVAPIGIDVPPMAILEQARIREIKTASLYRMLSGLSDLGEIAALFEELVRQEEGHATRLTSHLKALTR